MSKIKLHKLVLIVLFITITNALFAALPVNNPFRQKYLAETPAWTDSLHWEQVVAIADFLNVGELTYDSAVVRAFRSLGVAGGTIFFPSGTYLFSNDIDLPTNIILRGEIPVETDARKTSFAPLSRLVFPEYIPSFTDTGTPNNTAFKAIKSTGDVQNQALVYLDINRGRISLGSASSERILVFGVRQNNIAQPDASVPDMTFMNGWERFSYRHTRNISLNVNRCGAVVGCRCNDLTENTINPIKDDSYAQPGFKAKGTFVAKKGADPATAEDDPGGASSTGITAMKYGERCKFNYLDHYGIGISGKKSNPALNPVPINQQILLLDNWVLTTMRVSFFIEGIGGIARGNVKRDIVGKVQYMQSTGKGLNTNNAATYENRGLNFAGENLLIEDNDIDVQRHKFPSGYSSIDGEGIIIQWQDAWGFDTSNPASGANTRMLDITIKNNKVNSYIGIYDVQVPISNVTITGNDLLGKGNILIFKKEQTYRFDKLNIENNINLSGIQVGNGSGSVYAMPGANIFIKNNTGVPGATLKYPIQSVVQDNINFTIGTPYTETTMLPIVLEPYHWAYNTEYMPSTSVEFSSEIEAMDLSAITIKNDLGEIIKPATYIVGKKLIFGQNTSGGQKAPAMLMPTFIQTISIPAGSVKSKIGQQPNALIEWSYRTQSFYTSNISIKNTAEFAVYPNPASDYIIVKTESKPTSAITITSIDGRILKTILTEQNKTYVSVGQLNSGVYLLKYLNSITKLIIKK